MKIGELVDAISPGSAAALSGPEWWARKAEQKAAAENANARFRFFGGRRGGHL